MYTVYIYIYTFDMMWNIFHVQMFPQFPTYELMNEQPLRYRPQDSWWSIRPFQRNGWRSWVVNNFDVMMLLLLYNIFFYVFFLRGS